MATVTNKNGIEFDVDALVTDVNGKVDKDLVNCTVPYVMSRTSNSQGGVVEIWSDGFCVQTGIDNTKSASAHTVSLTNAYVGNYIVYTSYQGTDGSLSNGAINIYNKQASSFTVYTYSADEVAWRTEGYIR